MSSDWFPLHCALQSHGSTQPHCGECAYCLANAEIERLRAAIDALLLAIADKGSHPEYHDEVRRRHEREWPTLWRAIAAMQQARRG